MSVSVNMTSVLLAGAACAAGGLVRSRYERDCLVTEETKILSPKIKKSRTLVFLSDLHDKEFGADNERLLGAIREVEPDMVLIGGDMMIAKAERASLDVTGRLLDGLKAAGPCQVFYGNGNHEQRIRRERVEYGSLYEEFLELLKVHDVSYLPDRTVQVGDDICISGLDIAQRYYRDMAPAKMETKYITSRLGPADPGRFQILLAHSPLFFEAYADWGADLALAGHFHGGTIRIPGLGGLMTPQYQFFLPECAGTFEKGGSRMIVSRGLGTHSVNIRIFNKPQVVVVRLMPEAI